MLVRKAFFLFLRRRGLACGGAVLANAWGAVELSFQTGDAKKKFARIVSKGLGNVLLSKKSFLERTRQEVK